MKKSFKKIGFVLIILFFIISIFFFFTNKKEEISILNTDYLNSISDIDSFKVLSGHYAKDKNFVYLFVMSGLQDVYKVEKLPNMDINSFNVIESWFSKDKNGIYFYDDKIKDADIDSFEVLNESFAKDKNNVYFVDYDNSIDNFYCRKFKGIDLNSAKRVNAEYVKDKNNCFDINGNKISMFICDNADINYLTIKHADIFEYNIHKNYSSEEKIKNTIDSFLQNWENENLKMCNEKHKEKHKYSTILYSQLAFEENKQLVRYFCNVYNININNEEKIISDGKLCFIDFEFDLNKKEILNNKFHCME